jgi:hypothetical protein
VDHQDDNDSNAGNEKPEAAAALEAAASFNLEAVKAQILKAIQAKQGN